LVAILVKEIQVQGFLPLACRVLLLRGLNVHKFRIPRVHRGLVPHAAAVCGGQQRRLIAGQRRLNVLTYFEDGPVDGAPGHRISFRLVPLLLPDTQDAYLLALVVGAGFDNLDVFTAYVLAEQGEVFLRLDLANLLAVLGGA